MKNLFRACGWLAAVLFLFTAVNAHAIAFTLTVTAQGSGSVIRNPSNSSYPSNVTVTVTATPNAGWYFDSWSGDTNGSVNPLNVVMNTNLTITGNFLAYPTYLLTLTTNGQGTIALSPAGSTFYSNTIVTATATPAAGWVFTGWTGSAAGTTNPLSFTMNSANTLTGNFAQLPAFDVQPVGVTNSPGSTVSFFAHAVGNAPLVYQWYFNSTLLPGATNTTLAYTNVALAQAGSYQITATNSYGSATSLVTLLVLTNGSTNPVSVCDEPSLRAAIAKGGWVSIGCSGTITLTNTITITNNVTLDASGVNAAISGGGAVRLFNVQSGASLSITNLTLANGLVTNSLADTNPADGGAVCNNGGTLNLVGCTLTNNVVRNKYNNASAGFSTIGGFARGGAIYNNGGVVTLMVTSVSNNVADAGIPSGTATGGAIYSTNGTLTLTGCSLSRNACNSYQTNAAAGGAVCIISGTAHFANCLFNTNSAGGGSIANNGFYGIPATGGAIAQLGGNMTVNQCQFLSNLAQSGSDGGTKGPALGGAIYCAASANIADSSFNNNSAPADLARNPQNCQGGAIYNSGVMQLTGCCICSNFVQGTSGGLFQSGTGAGGNGQGAGIFNAGQLQMTNCTIALNRARGGFGYSGVTNGAAIGAGICNDTNATTICMNVTLASNLCSASGIGPYGYNPINGFSAGDQVANLGGTLRLHNALLAYAGTNGNAYGTITDDGYNISSDGSAAFASGTSYNSTDPKLGTLTDNGGSTLTMAPLAISPAIDFGDANGAPGTDQRGFLRPFGSGYDIGAVEYGSSGGTGGFTLTVVAQGSGSVIRNPSNSSYPSNVTVTVTATPNVGWYFSNWSGDTNGSVNPLNVVMNSSLNITGNFLAYPTYSLTLVTNGQGTIALIPAGSTFYSNTIVTATATPASGWVFAGWTGSAAGSTNPLTFAMNSANSLTGSFAQPPAFDVQPVGVTNSLGSTVSFFAHAVGTAPLAYQWYFNGTLLAGATNTTLAYTNVLLAQAGSYQITATNNYGSVTSSVALLVLTNGSTNPLSVCDEPSLRAAIVKGGWISIGCNGTITLTSTIIISNNVTLDASGVTATISGGSAVRLFNVTSAGSLTITNLTLANGMTNNLNTGKFADGGAVYNDGGTLHLIRCQLLNNVAYDTFTSSSQPPFYAARGGAIFNNGGTATLIGTFLGNNMASGTNIGFGGLGAGYGGAIYMTNGTLTLINCCVSSNSCLSCYRESEGGAVCVLAGNVVFSNSQFNANNASCGGTGNNMVIGGGSVALLGGNLTIRQCLFLNNQINDTRSLYVSAIRGGALFCADTVSILNSSFLNNRIQEASLRGNNKINANGGAICNTSNLTLNGCCIASNLVWGLDGSQTSGGLSQAGDGLGGGIYNAGQLKMTNCTITLNTAQGGLGYYPYPPDPNGAAIGAGVCNGSNASASFMNVTLASNLCTAFGNAFHNTNNGFCAGDQIANLGGSLRLHNTLLAYAGTNGNAYGTITDDGYNISSDGSAALFASGSSYNFTDPKLGPLADNGGPTLTMAPLAISPAIDFGDSNGAPHSDQRGFLRPFGDGVDIGAVEYGSIYPAPSPVNILFTHSAPNLLLNFSATPTIVYHLQSSTNLSSWTEVEAIGAFSSPSNISRTITPQGNTKKFYRVWYQ